MMDNKDKVVDGLTKGIEGLFKKNKVDYVIGAARIDGARQGRGRRSTRAARRS